MGKVISYSIIVPVYNESKRIHNLKEIVTYVKKLPGDNEVIAVNDGSKDDTLAGKRNLNCSLNF